MTTIIEPQRISSAAAPRKKYVPVVGPRLKILLTFLLAAFALMAVNSVYLVSITLLEWLNGLMYQTPFYIAMFGVHIALGLVMVVPFIVFGILHMRNARNRPNRRAVRAG